MMSDFFMRASSQRIVRIFDHKTRAQAGDFARQAGAVDAAQDFVEILVGGRSFVLGIHAAVREDIVRDEFIVHGFLVEFANRRFAALPGRLRRG